MYDSYGYITTHNNIKIILKQLTLFKTVYFPYIIVGDISLEISCCGFINF